MLGILELDAHSFQVLQKYKDHQNTVQWLCSYHSTFSSFVDLVQDKHSLEGKRTANPICSPQTNSTLY